MYSSSANSIWASNTYTQGVSETNWQQYKFQCIGGTSNLTIRTATSTSLVISNVNAVQSGDTLYLGKADGTFVSAAVGSVTDGTVSTSFSATYTAATPLTPYTNGTVTCTHFKPDGTSCFVNSYQGTGQGVIREFVLTTPFDLRTSILSGKSINHPAGSLANRSIGFGFSNDGKMLFCIGTSGSSLTGNILTSYSLGTAWDVTSVVKTVTSAAITSLTTTNQYGYLRISPDGRKIIVAQNFVSSVNNAMTLTLSTPFDVTTASYTSVTSSAYLDNGIGLNYAQIIHISDNGKTMIVYENATSVTGYIRQSALSTAWDVSTASLVNTFSFTKNGVNAGGVISTDGKKTNILTGTYTYGFDSDVNLGQVIDITSFALSVAPTSAYTKVPTVRVTADTSANRISSYSNKMYLPSGVATTTSVSFGYNKSNAFSVGDTVLLNGANSVTLTGVTETLNGYVYASVYNVAPAETSGMTLPTGISPFKGLRLCAQGSILFAWGTGTYGVGIYKFNLSTPYNISTGTLAPMPYGFYSVASIGGCDFSADGKTMVTVLTGVTGSGVIQAYSLSVPWDFTTALNTGNYNTSSATTRAGGRFNLTGTQFYITDLTNNVMFYSSLGTPYDLSTRGTELTASATPDRSGINGLVIEPSGFFMTAYGTQTYTIRYNSGALTAYNDVSTYNGSSLGSVGINISYSIAAVEHSDDGTKFYIGDTSGIVREYQNSRTITLQKYDCTYATQSYTPTSIAIPDRSTAQTLSLTVSNGIPTISGTTVTSNCRAISFRMSNNASGTTITSATINLWKSSS